MNAITKSYEKLLNIQTEGRDDKNSDEYRFPYEPTSYEVLERLVDERFVESTNIVLDYGCGCDIFFNPFSVEILKTVISKILDSYYENPGEICFIFYYPSDEYIGTLMTVDELMFYDEIDCRDLFSGKDERERVVVFKIDAHVGCISCA